MTTLQKAPTKIYLYLVLSSWGECWSISERKFGPEAINMVKIAEMEVDFHLDLEAVKTQIPEMKLGALYQKLGARQKELDDIKEEIQKLLCIGHDG